MARLAPSLLALGAALLSGCYESFRLSHDAGASDAGARDAGTDTGCLTRMNDAGVIIHDVRTNTTSRGGPLTLRRLAVGIARGGDQLWVRFGGQLENTTDTTQCEVRSRVWIEGTQADELSLFADPYDTGGAESTGCVAPGERAYFRGSLLSTRGAYTLPIQLVEHAFEMEERADAVPHPLRPEQVEFAFVEESITYSVEGTLRLTAPLAQLHVTTLLVTACGTLWPTTTTTYDDVEPPTLEFAQWPSMVSDPANFTAIVHTRFTPR